MQPDGNHIIARLLEIRDYIQQASGMLEALGTHRDPVIIVCLCTRCYGSARLRARKWPVGFSGGLEPLGDSVV